MNWKLMGVLLRTVFIGGNVWLKIFGWTLSLVMGVFVSNVYNGVLLVGMACFMFALTAMFFEKANPIKQAIGLTRAEDVALGVGILLPVLVWGMIWSIVFTGVPSWEILMAFALSVLVLFGLAYRTSRGTFDKHDRSRWQIVRPRAMAITRGDIRYSMSIGPALPLGVVSGVAGFLLLYAMVWVPVGDLEVSKVYPTALVALVGVIGLSMEGAAHPYVWQAFGLSRRSMLLWTALGVLTLMLVAALIMELGVIAVDALSVPRVDQLQETWRVLVGMWPTFALYLVLIVYVAAFSPKAQGAMCAFTWTFLSSDFALGGDMPMAYEVGKNLVAVVLIVLLGVWVATRSRPAAPMAEKTEKR